MVPSELLVRCLLVTLSGTVLRICHPHASLPRVVSDVGRHGPSPKVAELRAVGERELAKADAELDALTDDPNLSSGAAWIAAAAPCERPSARERESLRQRVSSWILRTHPHARIATGSDYSGAPRGAIVIRYGCRDATGTVIDVAWQSTERADGPEGESARSAVLRERGTSFDVLAEVDGVGTDYASEWAVTASARALALVDVDGDRVRDVVIETTFHEGGSLEDSGAVWIAGRTSPQDRFEYSGSVRLTRASGAFALRITAGEFGSAANIPPTTFARVSPNGGFAQDAPDVVSLNRRAAELARRANAADWLARLTDSTELDVDQLWTCELALETLGYDDTARRTVLGPPPGRGSAAAIDAIGEGLAREVAQELATFWREPRAPDAEHWRLPFLGVCEPPSRETRQQITRDVDRWVAREGEKTLEAHFPCSRDQSERCTYSRRGPAQVRFGCAGADEATRRGMFVVASWSDELEGRSESKSGSYERQALLAWKPDRTELLLNTAAERTCSACDPGRAHTMDVRVSQLGPVSFVDAVEHRSDANDRAHRFVLNGAHPSSGGALLTADDGSTLHLVAPEGLPLVLRDAGPGRAIALYGTPLDSPSAWAVLDTPASVSEGFARLASRGHASNVLTSISRHGFAARDPELLDELDAALATFAVPHARRRALLGR